MVLALLYLLIHLWTPLSSTIVIVIFDSFARDIEFLFMYGIHEIMIIAIADI